MAVLEMVPVAEITARSRQFHFLPTLLSLVALPFMAVGFLVAGLWVGCRWAFAAFLIGFEQASGRTQPRRRGPS